MSSSAARAPLARYGWLRSFNQDVRFRRSQILGVARPCLNSLNLQKESLQAGPLPVKYPFRLNGYLAPFSRTSDLTPTRDKC